MSRVDPAGPAFSGIRLAPLSLLSLLSLLACWPWGRAEAQDWTAFRGSERSGVAARAAAVSGWDLSRGDGVAWRVPVPGHGHSSPVIVGNRLFLTTVVDLGDPAGDPAGPPAAGNPFRLEAEMTMESAVDPSPKAWKVLCFDKRDGRLLWQRTAFEGPARARRHGLNSFATPTPAAAGDRLVVYFGEAGLFVYDLEGALIWKRDLGTQETGFHLDPGLEWGVASSPVVDRNRVYLQCDVHRQAFLAAYDLRDGREIWRVEREDYPSWSTPLVHRHGRLELLVTIAPNYVQGYGLATGAELFRFYWGMDITIPSPIAAAGSLFVVAGKGRSSPIVRIDPRRAAGNITLDENTRHNDAILWSHPRGGAITPTPLFYRGRLYVLQDMGVLSCFDGRTGRLLYRVRLAGNYFASPVAAGGRIYLANLDGDVAVIRAGHRFRQVGRGELGEAVLATPAISGGRLYFRSVGHLVALGAGKGSAAAATTATATATTATTATP